MHFVYNINFILADCWRVLYLVAKVANFLDTVVAGGVNFDYVDCVVLGKGPTYLALATWRAVNRS